MGSSITLLFLVAALVVFVANAQQPQTGFIIQGDLPCNATGSNATGLAAAGSAIGLVCNGTTLQVAVTIPGGKIVFVVIGPTGVELSNCSVDAALPISGCSGQPETGIVSAPLISTVTNTTLPNPLNGTTFENISIGTFKLITT